MPQRGEPEAGGVRLGDVAGLRDGGHSHFVYPAIHVQTMLGARVAVLGLRVWQAHHAGLPAAALLGEGEQAALDDHVHDRGVQHRLVRVVARVTRGWEALYAPPHPVAFLAPSPLTTLV